MHRYTTCSNKNSIYDNNCCRRGVISELQFCFLGFAIRKKISYDVTIGQDTAVLVLTETSEKSMRTPPTPNTVTTANSYTSYNQTTRCEWFDKSQHNYRTRS